MKLQVHLDPTENRGFALDERALENNSTCAHPFDSNVIFELALPSLEQSAFPSVVTPPEVFDSKIALAAFEHAIHRNVPIETEHVVKYLITHWRYFNVGERFHIKTELAKSMAKGEHTPLELAEWQKVLNLPDDPHVLTAQTAA